MYLFPSSLRDFGVAEGLSLGTVVQLLKIPRRGKEPQTAAEWRQLYTVVRKYLDDDVDTE